MIENVMLQVDTSMVSTAIRLTLAIVVGIGSYYYFKKRFLKRKK
jgi:hypothetical protein